MTRLLALSLLCGCFFNSLTPAWAAEERTWPTPGGVIDLPMYADPTLDGPPQINKFHPRLEILWRQAMQRPESELRLQAVIAFGRAREQGMEGLEDVVPDLVAAMKGDAEEPVRVAAASALVVFDDPSVAADVLAQNVADASPRLAVTTDPGLAKWKHQPAYDTWLARVADAKVLESVRLSAIESLGAVGEARAVTPLTTLAKDRSSSPQLRLAAARALSQLANTGLTADAEALAGGDVLDRLVAATMLAGHGRADAEPVLSRLLGDADLGVAAAAAASLNRVDTAALAALAANYVNHADAGVRASVVEALTAHPDARAVELLAGRLGDPSGKVRHPARAALTAFARERGLDAEVRSAATAVLAGNDWRALEQSAILLGNLDHEPAADRLIELLAHERGEVRVAAAAALRELAVPATLPAMLARAETLTADAGSTPPEQPGDDARSRDHEAAQLFQAFAAMGYKESEPLLRKYIPKRAELGATARGAAIYAIGKFHEGTLDTELASQFASRLSDLDPMNPELTEPRRFSAIALGRMKAQGQLSLLRRFHEEENSSPDIGGATRWAIMQITGEELPPLETLNNQQTDWFLRPTN